MGEPFSARILLDELEEEQPENGEVYFGHLLCDADVASPQQLCCSEYDYELSPYYEKCIKYLSPDDRAFLVQCSAENKKQLTEEQLKQSIKKFAPDYYEEHYADDDEDDYEDDDYDDDDDYEQSYQPARQQQSGKAQSYADYPFNPIKCRYRDSDGNWLAPAIGVSYSLTKEELNQRVNCDAVLKTLYEKAMEYSEVLSQIRRSEDETGMFDLKKRALNASRKRDLKNNVIEVVSKIIERNLEIELKPLKEKLAAGQAEMKVLPLTSPKRRSLKAECVDLEDKIERMIKSTKVARNDYIKQRIERGYFR